jgi:hypothetical protein
MNVNSFSSMLILAKLDVLVFVQIISHKIESVKNVERKNSFLINQKQN